MSQRFLDEVKVFIKAGDGGNGCIAFHREKFVPKGGPSGGNAGRGGSIYLVADENKHTLNDFLHGVHFKAPSGQHGLGSKCSGSNAKDMTLHVPCGTLVLDPDTDEVQADLAYPGQVFLVARGGAGGRGNAAFASHTYRLPRFAERGEPGEERWVRLVLKLIASVGIIGFPNAGKSTLLSRVSKATPRIASYPFTTLVPNLGMVWLDENRRAVFADIPGLIEGAHEGVGLGTRFLRHVERTRLLVHLVDASTLDLEDPLKPYRIIRSELTHYGKGLGERPEIVVLNKLDLPEASDRIDAIIEAYRREGIDPLTISAKEATGIDRLLDRVNQVLESTAPVVEEESEGPLVELVDEVEGPSPEALEAESGAGLEGLALQRLTRRRTPVRFTVRQEGDAFYVEGRGIERMVAMTDLANDEAVSWIQRRLLRMGVEDALKHAGAVAGARVIIRGMEFEFQDEAPRSARPTRSERRTVGGSGRTYGRTGSAAKAKTKARNTSAGQPAPGGRSRGGSVKKPSR